MEKLFAAINAEEARAPRPRRRPIRWNAISGIPAQQRS
jgi:hypothetical protein